MELARVEVLRVACPKCGAGQGEACRSRTGRPVESHTARYQQAEAAGAFGAGTGPATEEGDGPT